MKPRTLIAGIDPGLSGAIALYDPAKGDFRQVIDMPTHEVRVNRKSKRRLDLIDLAGFFEDVGGEIALAIIENVNALPKQGVTSGFNFGYATGAITGIVAANFIPITRVTPLVWRRQIKLVGGKDASRQRASELFPRSAHHWPLKKHDGRAESALLAYYGHVFARPMTPIEPMETIHAPISPRLNAPAIGHREEDPAPSKTPAD